VEEDPGEGLGHGDGASERSPRMKRPFRTRPFGWTQAPGRRSSSRADIRGPVGTRPIRVYPRLSVLVSSKFSARCSLALGP
jgi:hypothetical protein